MKVLIWVLCIFAYAVFTTLLGAVGIKLGAIPTWILIWLYCTIANKLCKKLDDKKSEEAIPEDQLTSEQAESSSASFAKFDRYDNELTGKKNPHSENQKKEWDGYDM